MSDKDYNIFYDNYLSTNATTEVTGLIPWGETQYDQWELYRDVFDFEPIPTPEIEFQKKKKESL